MMQHSHKLKKETVLLNKKTVWRKKKKNTLMWVP